MCCWYSLCPRSSTRDCCGRFFVFTSFSVYRRVLNSHHGRRWQGSGSRPVFRSLSSSDIVLQLRVFRSLSSSDTVLQLRVSGCLSVIRTLPRNIGSNDFEMNRIGYIVVRNGWAAGLPTNPRQHVKCRRNCALARRSVPRVVLFCLFFPTRTDSTTCKKAED